MIKEFRGEYRWLSNFAPCEIHFNGMRFASVEHAYMSAKSNDPAWKDFCADARNAPGKVKKKSKSIELRKDWESIKVSVMRQLLEKKFSQEPFKTLLLNTGGLYIQEGNRWGDTFWGVDLKTNEGENQLGVLIMSIRDRLLKEEPRENRLRTMMKAVTGFFRRRLRLG
jgi:ribA/ribD-fused uncharacterized protein